MWEAFRDNYEDLLENAKNTKMSTKDVRTKYMSRYTLCCELMSFLDALVYGFKSKPANKNGNMSMHLPPCDTQTFSVFGGMFSVLYGTNPHITNIQKMYYILQKTEAEVRDIIQTCAMTNDGFDMACKNLVDRYENKRVLVKSQLKTLFNLSVIERESGPAIKRLQSTINDCIINLSLLGIET